ncbi:hypothetical protein GBA52_018162 [Prunus armeniaca]|nr:hypothetical protein GBA52_018162 [Prunus armeniaca]
MHMGTSILLRPNLSPCEEMVMCLSFNARFWGFMPPFWFTSPDLPHSNPFGAVPWLPSDRFLLSSSKCTGVYGSGGDGDSRADLYSDPLSPRSIWFHLLATAAIQQTQKSRTKWNLCRATAQVLAPPLSSLKSCFPCLGAAMIVVGLWWLICGGFMFHLSLLLFCLLGSFAPFNPVCFVIFKFVYMMISLSGTVSLFLST